MSHIKKIPYHEFDFSATRSRGPGGQNVNKTNSAVMLRWSVLATQAFDFEQIQILMQKLSNQLTVEGELLIRSETHRDQDQNKKACLEKLDLILAKAFFVAKKRKATRPTRSSQAKRVNQKKQRSEIKKNRRSVTDNY